MVYFRVKDDVIQTLYDSYVLARNKQKIELNNCKLEAETINKEIKAKEQKANKLMGNITSGDVEGLALKGMDYYFLYDNKSNFYNNLILFFFYPPHLKFLIISFLPFLKLKIIY